MRRTFSRDVPIRKGSHWKQPYDKEARGMLNLRLTGNPYDFVNGVVIDVPLDELDDILRREVGYDLVPVMCVDWDEDSPNWVSYLAYTFRAKAGSQYASREINPRPGYYELVRDAAKDYGPAFYLTWMQTTFFADGETPISLWEEAWKKKECKTLAK